MKRILVIFLFLPLIFSWGQKLGKVAEEKGLEKFPPHSWGVDIMFGEGGFGLGTFLRQDFTENITGFIDLSVAESKDDREIEFVDYFGRKFVIGKVNRVFLLPLNVGIHYRLFSHVLTENLRPYINFGVGPTFVITTPYKQEFFSAFGDAIVHYAAGGYIGVGANFGMSKSSLVGINVRYYKAYLFDEGVESLKGRIHKNIGQLYITLNIGMMY